MRKYAVFFVRSARKELESLPSAWQRRIFDKVASLSENPRPPGCRKLQASRHLWRIRIGDYRAVYSIDPISRMIDVIAIRHRSGIYR